MLDPETHLLGSQAPLTIHPHFHPSQLGQIVLQAVVPRVRDEVALNT